MRTLFPNGQTSFRFLYFRQLQDTQNLASTHPQNRLSYVLEILEYGQDLENILPKKKKSNLTGSTWKDVKNAHCRGGCTLELFHEFSQLSRIC